MRKWAWTVGEGPIDEDRDAATEIVARTLAVIEDSDLATMIGHVLNREEANVPFPCRSFAGKKWVQFEYAIRTSADAEQP